MPYPTIARCKFGDGRAGEVKHAAEIKVGIARRRGASAAFVSEAAIPALLRKGAFEVLGANSVSNVIFYYSEVRSECPAECT